jgi:hypothetical protein
MRCVKWDFEDIGCGEHREGYRAYCHPDVFQPMTPLVYHNDGNGHFTEVSAKIGLDKPGKGLGLSIADFDRDGKIDVAIANDSMLEHLYRKKGAGTFEKVGLPAEIAVDHAGRLAAGDGRHRRQLSFGQRQAPALRPRHGQTGSEDRDSLAERHRPNAQVRCRRPDPHGRRTGEKGARRCKREPELAFVV